MSDRKPLTTLRINRFAVPVSLADEFVCGGVQDQFVTAVELSTRGLTQEGFVYEVHRFMEEVQTAFNPDRMLVASCESLAGGVAFVAHRLLGDRLDRVNVVVENRTGSVQLLWEKGDELPEFPQQATAAQKKATKDRRGYHRQPSGSGC